MCGGIIAACSRRPSGIASVRWRLALGYNVGRIASYVLAGVAAGAIGQAALALRPGPAAQQIALVAAGASMLCLALYVAGIRGLTQRMEAIGALVWRRLQPHSRRLLPVDTVGKAIGLGALWGWLPCGMVYGVLLTAVASAGALEGGVVMLAFGLGTLPNVLAIGALTARTHNLTTRPWLRFGVAAAVAGFGVFALILAAHPHAVAASFCIPGSPS
jgi:sulfite exporter TauE/SafE